MELPELEEFRRQLTLLRQSLALTSVVRPDGRYALSSLSLPQVADLLRDVSCGYYFLLAAAQLNRTSLRKAAGSTEAQLVPARQRRAFAVKIRLPVSSDFDSIAINATALRQSDLQRKARGATEGFFRDRLVEEQVPLLMSPPRRVVPGVVIAGRKPDGVWPDPATGVPPVLYVEVKRIQRVADDIQKRLYELAEASLEMKMIYGTGTVSGLGVESTLTLDRGDVAGRLRAQFVGVLPVVVGLFLCPRDDAERYRSGAEALIDRIFFEEEIEECIEFIREVIERHTGNGGSTVGLAKHGSPIRTTQDGAIAPGDIAPLE